jgi:hypothetical protein
MERVANASRLLRLGLEEEAFVMLRPSLAHAVNCSGCAGGAGKDGGEDLPPEVIGPIRMKIELPAYFPPLRETSAKELIEGAGPIRSPRYHGEGVR